jgi:hypothetical protein
MCGVLSFFYGVLRNALWDDAAEATSGQFARKLGMLRGDITYIGG